MTYVLVHCPDCQGVDVVRYGKQRLAHTLPL